MKVTTDWQKVDRMMQRYMEHGGGGSLPPLVLDCIAMLMIDAQAFLETQREPIRADGCRGNEG